MDGDISKWTLEYYKENTSECEDALEAPDFFERVPILTKENFQSYKDGDFIRYQGIVQDFLHTEYFMGDSFVINKRTQEKSAKSDQCVEDSENEPEEDEDTKNLSPNERSAFYFVPIPCTNSWVKEYYQEPFETASSESDSNGKRSAEESQEEDVLSGDDEAPDQGTKTKKTSASPGEVQLPRNHFQSIEKYFPMPDERDGLPCIVKIYEELDEEGDSENQICLNDRIEVVGFLSLNPVMETVFDNYDEDDATFHPPPSVAPRIQALRYRKLAHNNPLLSQTINEGEITSNAEKIRNDLHLALTQLFYGDGLAADYVICYLISSVYYRQEDQALGNFSLNLFNIKMENYSRIIYSTLEMLVTNSQYVGLNIDFFNKQSLVPRKDYETDRLFSGRLQLADGTFLVIDETPMNEGQLISKGIQNFCALQTLIRDQEIFYDFSYYNIKYYTDFPVMILSEGRSMLQTRFQLKIQKDPSMTESVDETFKSVSDFLCGEIRDEIRKYLTCMKLMKFKMSKELSSKITEDYVNMRQQGTGINTNDLHNFLVLSRFLALSHGKASLTVDDWSRALEMEAERKARMK